MANALQNLASRAAAFVKDESTIVPAVSTPPTASATIPMCSKCGQRPRADADGTNPWCKECRAEYQREYESGRLNRKEAKGFALGVSAMRKHLAEQFDKIGFSSLEAWEVRDAILQSSAPPMPED